VLLFTDGRSNVPLRRGGLNLRAFRQVKIESELRDVQEVFANQMLSHRAIELFHTRLKMRASCVRVSAKDAYYLPVIKTWFFWRVPKIQIVKKIHCGSFETN